MGSSTLGDRGAPQAEDCAGNATNDPSHLSRTSLRVRSREAARQVESQIILEALERNQWNRRRTADALKISYRSLMYKMKYCHLRANDRPGGSGVGE
jgi:DNA-binding NtrC family response regulator